MESVSPLDACAGKETSITPQGIVRRLKTVSLPFLLSLFRLGEDAALALESRGVGTNEHPTWAVTIRWSWKDSTWTISAALAASVLWLIR
ncbi:energy-coupling factor transporter transmembrane component T family protein [Cohnella faecalis]|uniref:Energy-coupling factor transporter transmembrane protein EcfT n=1 Tax=Cohnella faecalis TaxID=2315694 RepID=A0A398CL31_9BACL|nr:hypothetical protein [Cohnella faecalis]RIE03363.1 hypothetical protein D3H35_11830 [Cohnella faecalis]